MSEDIGENVAWSSRLEEYFASTGEKAHCLSLIHKKAEALYSQRRNFIDLPVIIISSVVGFLSVGSSTMFPDGAGASIGLGVGSLLVSVLNTTGSYFQWAKKAEANRISAIHYAKLYRFLNIEMSLPRTERMSPRDLLKYTKDSYDRLQEISPLIPPSIIREFKRDFAGKPEYKNISMPEEANGLEHIVIYNEAFSPAFSSPDHRPPVELKIREVSSSSVREAPDTPSQASLASVGGE
jgi:hypothetical protein